MTKTVVAKDDFEVVPVEGQGDITIQRRTTEMPSGRVIYTSPRPPVMEYEAWAWFSDGRVVRSVAWTKEEAERRREADIALLMR